MSIETRIQAINDHLIDDYKVLRLAGADLTGVNKNIVNLKMSWKERLLYFMNNGTDEVWNNWDKVSGTGTTLSLNNTEEAPMSLTYKGNTSQTGTPTPSSPIPVQVVSGDNTINVVGKNLINLQATQVKRENATYSNITVSNNTLSFEITGSRSGYVGYIIPTTIGQNYVLSFNLAKGFIYTIELDNVISDISGNFGLERTTPYTYTATKQYLGVWLSGGNTTDNQASVSNLMLEKGNEATTYQPYQSASYPIGLGDKELCKIGTYQDKIDKSSGKNLINLENFLANATGVVKNTDGSYTFTSTTTMYNTPTPLSKIVNDSVTITYKVKNGTGTNFRIRWVYEDGYIQDTAGSGTGTSEVTLTSTSYELSLHGKVVGITANFSSGGTYTIRDFMINEGTTALEYEPYGTGWYLKKEIGKVVLNSDSNVLKYTGTDVGRYYISGITGLKGSASSPNAKSNYFDGAFSTSNGSIFVSGADGSINMINTAYNNDLAGFKTWLGTTNPNVYYVLATPMYETITDTNLIGQLEALKKSCEEQTNISQVNNDLPFELSVTALEVMS